VNPALLPIGVLVAVTLAGVIGLRQFPRRIRLAFDAVLFVAISIYFERQGALPLFPPLHGSPDIKALALRAAGGAWWLLGSRLVVRTLRFVVYRDRRSREARLFSDLAAGGIYIATGLIVLNSVFALPITGVVATSGVAAIVLGLALQNTLADVFAGIAVGIEGPFRVGDRICIGDKVEGQVIQINWRSTRIQTDGDDVAIYPNSLVARAEIVNQSFPSQRRAGSIELSCPADALPERVIEALMHSTLLCPDILPTPPARAVVTHLGWTRNQFKVSFFVDSPGKLATTKDLLLRSARRQLHCAGLLRRPAGPGCEGGPAIGTLPTCRELLRDLILFEALSDDQIDVLAARLTPLSLEPGQVLFSEGETDEALYVIAGGIVEISRQSVAALDVIGCVGAGEYVGEIELLTGAAHAGTATTRTHCRIYRMPHEALAPLMAASEELMDAIGRSAQRGLDILSRDVATRAAPNVGGPAQLLERIRSLFQL